MAGGVQGIGGGGFNSLTMSFRESNVQANRIGEQVTAQKMYGGLIHLSSSGTETNLGTSEFQKGNNQIFDDSVKLMAEIMERDDQYTEVSNSGLETLFSPAGFQEQNDRSFDAHQQIAANSYKYFNS